MSVPFSSRADCPAGPKSPANKNECPLQFNLVTKDRSFSFLASGRGEKISASQVPILREVLVAILIIFALSSNCSFFSDFRKSLCDGLSSAACPWIIFLTENFSNIFLNPKNGHHGHGLIKLNLCP